MSKWSSLFDMFQFGPSISMIGSLVLVSFMGNIGDTDNLYAELLAHYNGLLLAWNKGYKNVVCYSDSLDVLKLVEENRNVWHHYAHIIENIQEVLKLEWNVMFSLSL